MKHTITEANWTMSLADAIENSASEDVIVVFNEAQKELGERARQRMCPDKKLVFEVCEHEDDFGFG